MGIQDGDTLTLLTAELREVRIRLGDIDAHESDQPHGDRSKRILSDLAFGRDVEVAVDGVDAYRRSVGRARPRREGGRE